MRRMLSVAIVFAVALRLIADEPNPSPRQRELIEKLLEQISNRSTVDAVFAQLEKQLVRAGDSESKELFAAFRDRARAIDFAALMREAQIRIYAKHFTEAELADLVAFYATPTGRKAIQVMPQVVSEGMQAGMDNLAPKIQQIMAQIIEEQDAKRRLLRKTMSDMKSVATALDAYQTDLGDGAYPGGGYPALNAALKIYMTKFPEKDMWGNPYAYVVSEDRHHYRIVSSGADSKFESDSLRIALPKPGEGTITRDGDRFKDDIICADGAFIHVPVQTKSIVKKEN